METIEKGAHARIAGGEIATQAEQFDARDGKPFVSGDEERLDAAGDMTRGCQIAGGAIRTDPRKIQEGFANARKAFEQAR